MIFRPTILAGVYLVEEERKEDERGYFARTYCAREFGEKGLCTQWAQCNVSHNSKKGTLRGMHYQAAPHGETKLIRCTAGAVHDVLIDLRPDSPTHKQYFATTLAADLGVMLYVPEGIAHGFQTLADHSVLFYQMSCEYHPASARGVRYDDPAFHIEWPAGERVISDRDRAFPDYPPDNRA